MRTAPVPTVTGVALRAGILWVIGETRYDLLIRLSFKRVFERL
ncbi:hypothetical protein [Pararobbsia alpina]|uniref:Uncharacterized protein n=1 Tax=Pararobbsia alpina TaxID=621374 RepID=A0A6S7BGI4_9BURK|nr:hypothetical protein [Pararobbsia alpina]CAB3799209.1 hypothetical protein LMG28138_04611 [Pararobbsia alpina]